MLCHVLLEDLAEHPKRGHMLSPPLRQAGSCHQICFVAMSSFMCCAVTNTCRNNRFCCSCAWQPPFSLFVLYSPPVLGHGNSFQSCWWVCVDVLVLPSSVLAVPGTAEAVGFAWWQLINRATTRVTLAITRFLCVFAAF